MADDPFDDLLGLEDKYYQEGYELGATDGSRAGRIEGRVFGLEKGFEKFVELGTLHGRAIVWAARSPGLKRRDSDGGVLLRGSQQDSMDLEDGNHSLHPQLPSLPVNTRLEKHIQTLYALSEPASLSTQNTEDAVADFDDRFKRAQAKAKVIEKIIGENGPKDHFSNSNNPGNSQDISGGSQVRLKRRQKPTGDAEDFDGGRLQI